MKSFFFILFLGLVVCSLFSEVDYPLEDADLEVIQEEDPYLYSLLLEKKKVHDLYNDGEFKGVERSFKKEQKRLDRYIKKKDIENLSYQYNDTQIIFGDIPTYQDLLIYYGAEYFFLNGAINKARSNSEILIEEYPESEKYQETILLLMQIYFLQQENEQLVEIADFYNGKYSEDQKFWLAQSYFNLEQYELAEEKFQEIRKSKIYGFRAEMMMALIDYFSRDIDTSLKHFFALEEKHKPKTDYYYFLYISMARLLKEKELLAAALEYYEKFVVAYPTEISDEIYFEIASSFREYGDYDKSIYYYSKIVEKPKKSSYFPAAKYYVSIVQQEKGDFDQAKENLEDIIAQNTLVMETLNVKYKLMNKYNKLCYDIFFQNPNEEEKSKKEKKCQELENAIDKTNRTLQDLYTGVDRKSVLSLNLIEEEYFSYSTTIEYMEAIIQLAKTTKNKRVPKIIDGYIVELDSSLVMLGVINYLGHLPQVSRRDIQIARILIEERMYEEKLISAWHDISKMAEKRNDPEMKASAERSFQLLSLNLESLDKISQIAFKGSPSPEIKEIIEAETKAIEQNITELNILKQQVIEKFNLQIAKKLSKEKSNMINEFDFLKNSYDDVIGIMAGDINSTNENYQFNLLDVYFRESKSLDQQYEEIQKNYQDNINNE